MTIRRRPALVLLGAGCLAGVLLLGVAVGDGGTAFDRALMPTRLCAGETAGTVCENLATEGGWPFPVYATALAPLLVAGLLLLGRLRRPGGHLDASGWLWSLAAVAALPAQHLLSTVFDRVGPWHQGHVDLDDGAYPSGAAALVAVAWGIGGVVAWRLRPRWRPGGGRADHRGVAGARRHAGGGAEALADRHRRLLPAGRRPAAAGRGVGAHRSFQVSGWRGGVAARWRGTWAIALARSPVGRIEDPNDEVDAARRAAAPQYRWWSAAHTSSG